MHVTRMNGAATTHQPAAPGTNGLRILLVDDQREIYEYVQRVLSERQFPKRVIDFAASGPEARERLVEAMRAGSPYFMAMVDFMMPQWDGLRTARELWALDPDLRVILASGAPALGTDDLLSQVPQPSRLLVLQKPFLPAELRQMVRICAAAQRPPRPAPSPAAPSTARPVEPRVELEHLLQSLLSGPHSVNHALMSIGIDRLRQHAGASGLSSAASCAREITEALTRRLGNRVHHLFAVELDEIALVLLDCSHSEALAVAQDLVAHVGTIRLSGSDAPADVSLSIGVVPIVPGEDQVRSIQLAAEVARRAAYASGGDTAHAAAIDDTTVVMQLNDTRTVPEIEFALKNDRFELWAQPIVPLSREAGLRPSLEILLRMRDRSNVLRGPGEFLPIAERHGLAPRIDRMVLRRALALLEQPAVRSHINHLAVNISAYLLGDQAGLAWLEETLLASRSTAHRLCLEITESAALRNTDAVRDFVARMADTGIRFALDDFGSGFSTFNYLQTLPVHDLKIDGSLVRDCATDARRREFLRRISDIGHLWGKRTVAEHIEDRATLEIVQRLGIDFAQGYALAKPVPLEEALHAAELAMSRLAAARGEADS